MEKAVIVDIDGVVLDCPGWTDMEEFYRNLDQCFPRTEITLLVNALNNFGVKIIFLTARNEKYCDKTKKQLEEIFTFPIELEMRGISDLREDFEMKKEKALILLDKYEILFAIDDNLKNCDMFEELGITSFWVRNKFYNSF